MSRIYDFLLQAGVVAGGGDYKFVSNSTNYIDTGIAPTQTTVFESTNDFPNVTRELEGVMDGTIDFAYGFEFGQCKLFWDTVTRINGPDVGGLNPYEINGGILTEGGLVIYDQSVTPLSAITRNAYLLACNRDGSIFGFGSREFYGAKITHGGSVYEWRIVDQAIEYYIDDVYQNDAIINGTVNPSQWVSI